jgi:hypothetical protein
LRRTVDMWFAALVLFAGFICVELGLYLTYTDAGLDGIEGLTARYYLPLVPFSLFVLPLVGRLLAWLLREPKWRRMPAAWFCLPAIIMAVVNIVALPLFILHATNIPGP